MQTELDQLMDRYAQGDDAAFEPLYDALAPRLTAYLRRAIRDSALAEDLAQQTFLRLHRARASFERGGAVVPWAYAIARRLMLDAARTKRRHPEAIIDVDLEHAPLADPEASTASREELAHLESKLAQLPDDHRTAFELIRVEGLSLAEAAAVVGVTPTAMKMRAHRAYVALGISSKEGAR